MKLFALLGLLALTLVLFVGAVLQAQSPQSNDPTAALLQQLAQERGKLGECNADLGPLQQLSAQVMSGQVQSVTATIAKVKKAIESANPDVTLNTETWKLEPVFKDSTPAGKAPAK